MNAVEIYEKAQRSLNRNEITVGEFEEQIAELKDVEPVVRCKDCDKISPSVTPIKDAVWCREFRAYMPCGGFCSYGERRNDGKPTSA